MLLKSVHLEYVKKLLHSFTPFKKTVTDLKPYFYGLYSVVLILLLVVSVLFFCIPKTYAATYTWDGGGGDNNWSTCANWSSDTCPTSADTATFNTTSTKDATIDASFGGTITTLNINSGYTGTITMARSFTLTTFTQGAGSFTAANQILDINGVFTLSAGTFTASNDTSYFASTFTISGTPTFNHNNGTIIFDGATSPTLSCNNVSFNAVTLAHTGGVKTINSNCTLPLGNNPLAGITAGSITLNGTLTGSGVLTTVGTFTLNSGAVLSGFTGLVSSALVISGATLNLSNYTTVDINSTFTFSSGTLTASSGTMTFAGAIFISGTAVFHHNNGIVALDGTSGGTISCNNVTFNLVTIINTSGQKTINSDCNIPLGNNPTIMGVVLNGTLSGTGVLTSTGTITHNSGGILSGFTGISLVTLTVSGANADFASYSSFTASSTVTLSSGTLSLPSGADLNGSLVISGGTFNAPSGSMTVAGALTISGSPTFNHNNGIITFDGGGATLSCNNVTFNRVNLWPIGSTKTVNSNCNLPLGNDPTLNTVSATTAVVLNGTLSGTGILTTRSLTLNSGASLAGFSGFVGASNVVIAGATIDFSTYTTADFNGTTAFTLSSGSFTAPAGIMTVAGAFNITGGTFNHNNGTLTFDGSTTSTLSCNNVTFNLVTFAHTAGTKTINNDCSMPLGANPISNRALTLNGTLSGSGALSVLNTFILNSGAILSGFNAISAGNFQPAGANLDLSSYTSVTTTGGFTLSAGTFTAPPLMTIGGNWTLTGGTFNHNNGTVVLIRDTNTNTITGSTTFYNLTKIITSSETLTFTAGSTQTILGTLTLKGTSGNNLILSSSSSGTQWNIDPQGTRSIEYVEVKDSNNSNATAINAGQESYDLGNNTNWNNLIATGTSDALSTSGGVIEQASNSGWWNYNWVWRKQLTFNNTSSNLETSSETLTNFPVLVKLTSSNFDFNKAKSDGSDIRFIDADNKTTLSYEIEKWDKTNQQAFIWVKIPQIDANSNSDFIYLYSGNPNALDAQGVRSVWDSNFAGVWHMKEQGATTYDSTQNSNNGTKVSISQPQYSASGKIDGAQIFDGTNDYIDLPETNILSNAQQWTISLWIYNHSIATFMSPFGDSLAVFGFPTVRYNASKYQFYAGNGSSFFINGVTTNSDAQLNIWENLTFIYNKFDLLVYRNGILTDTLPALDNQILQPTSTDYRIGGGSSTSSRAFKGLIDEFRVSTSSRSSAWIAAEYKSGIDEYINYESTAVVPSGQSLNIASNVGSGDNGKLRIRGTMRSGSNLIILNKVECSANGGSYQGAIAVDGEFNEHEEEYYFDFLSSDNGWKGEGYSVRCRATHAGGVVIDNVTYFTPFTLNAPSKDAIIADSNPQFSFSVIKHHDMLKESIAKYQIQIRRPNVGSWNTYIDNIPTDRQDGTYLTDTSSIIISDRSSTINVQSKKSQLSGPYVWKAVAIDKSGHTLDTETRSLLVKNTQTISPAFALAVLNITGLGNVNISTSYPQGIKDSYTTVSATPQFYGIAPARSLVSLIFTDTACQKNNPNNSCRQVFTTTANAASRFGINIPTHSLRYGATYQLAITAQRDNEYTELPSLKFMVFQYQPPFPTPSYPTINKTSLSDNPIIIPTSIPKKTIPSGKKIKTESQKRKMFCLFLVCF